VSAGTSELKGVYPPAFGAGTFTINSYVADDSSVAVLNGTELSNTGIFGPGSGFFSFDGWVD
jgi:hypothetical protein